MAIFEAQSYLSKLDWSGKEEKIVNKVVQQLVGCDAWARSMITITETMRQKTALLDTLIKKANSVRSDKIESDLRNNIRLTHSELMSLDDQLYRLIEENYNGLASADSKRSKNNHALMTSPSERDEQALREKENLEYLEATIPEAKNTPTLFGASPHELVCNLNKVRCNYKQGAEESKIEPRMGMDIHNELTIKQASAIARGWEWTLQSRDGEEWVEGLIMINFFENLFSRQPDIKPLFIDITVQSEFFAGLVDLLIPNTSTNHKTYIFLLIEQAQQHSFMGLSEHVYDAACDALGDVIEERLGDQFNQRIKEAWLISCQAVTLALLSTQDYYSKPVARKTGGFMNAVAKLRKARHNEVNVMTNLSSDRIALVRNKSGAVAPELTIKQAAIINKAWKEVIESKDDTQTDNIEARLAAMSQMFQDDLFSRCVDARPIFGSSTRQQIDFFMSMVVHIVPNAYGVNYTRDVVEMGEQHAKLGITREIYKSACEALTCVMKQQLGGKFDTKLREAWLASCNLVCESMLAAHKLSQHKLHTQRVHLESSDSPVGRKNSRGSLWSGRHQLINKMSTISIAGKRQSASSGSLGDSWNSLLSKPYFIRSHSEGNVSPPRLHQRTPPLSSIFSTNPHQPMTEKRAVIDEASLEGKQSPKIARKNSGLTKSDLLHRVSCTVDEPVRDILTQAHPTAQSLPNINQKEPHFEPNHHPLVVHTNQSLVPLSSKQSLVVSKSWRRVLRPPDGGVRKIEQISAMFFKTIFELWPDAKVLLADSKLERRFFISLVSNLVPGQPPRNIIECGEKEDQTRQLYVYGCDVLLRLVESLDAKFNDGTRHAWNMVIDALVKFFGVKNTKEDSEAEVLIENEPKFIVGSSTFPSPRLPDKFAENMSNSSKSIENISEPGPDLEEVHKENVEEDRDALIVYGWGFVTETCSLEKLMDSFYTKLFQLCPENKKVFYYPKKNVEAMTDLFVALVSVTIPGHNELDLYGIGHYHKVPKDMYPYTCMALKNLVAERLGKLFTKEMRQAWDSVGRQVCQRMNMLEKDWTEREASQSQSQRSSARSHEDHDVPEENSRVEKEGDISAEDAKLCLQAWELANIAQEGEEFVQGEIVNIFWSTFFDKLPEARPAFNTMETRRAFFTGMVLHVFPSVGDNGEIVREPPPGGISQEIYH
eukprot:Ihof_evm3s410 gene=Ihof_evmTU3s410